MDDFVSGASEIKENSSEEATGEQDSERNSDSKGTSNKARKAKGVLVGQESVEKGKVSILVR